MPNGVFHSELDQMEFRRTHFGLDRTTSTIIGLGLTGGLIAAPLIAPVIASKFAGLGIAGIATKGGGILQAGEQLFSDVATDTDVNADADETSDFTNDTASFDLFDNTWGY